MKKKRKINKKLVVSVFSLIMILLLIYSSYNIIKWLGDNKKTNEEINDIEDIVDVDEVEDDDNTNLVNPDEDKDSDYWDYIKMNLINVNFANLKNVNSDTVGWIQVNGTNINYPIVQANNNDYYLNHSFKKKINDAGWVFMDYRNSIDNRDKNTIIYAHGRVDKTMFGTLKNVLSNGWLDNKDNYIVKLSTAKENTLWQVFSVYKIPVTSDYLQIDFNTGEFDSFVNMLKDRSEYDFKANVNENDYILTLSTCYNNSTRVVMHAKLIKQSYR